MAVSISTFARLSSILSQNNRICSFSGFLLCRYEEYLEDVIDASEEFHEVSEVMSRHATLLATNLDLRQQQQRVTDQAEESRCLIRLMTFTPD